MGNLATLGAGGPSVLTFVPTDIAGLQLWLDADNIAQADNTTVATWTDASGSGNNATGASGQTLQTAEINGHAVVRFDGTDDFMTVAGITNNDATRTIFLVAKIIANVANDAILSWATGAGFYMTTGSGGSVYWSRNSVSTNVTVGTSVGTTNAHLFAIRFNSTSSADAFYDSGSATNFDPDDLYQSGSAAIALASRNSLGTVFGNVDIAAILIYNSALSDPDVSSVGTYLRTRYGI